MSDWQLIETAPLNEDVILGWWESNDGRTYEWRIATAWAGASNTKPPGMLNGWRHGRATHWMPLPEPPK